jgi:hypothetical protein
VVFNGPQAVASTRTVRDDRRQSGAGPAVKMEVSESLRLTAGPAESLMPGSNTGRVCQLIVIEGAALLVAKKVPSGP